MKTINVKKELPLELHERRSKENKIQKKGFVVQLTIFDRKLEMDIVKWDKMCIEDLEKLDNAIKQLLEKFK